MKCYSVRRLPDSEDQTLLGIYLDWTDCERVVKQNGKFKRDCEFKKHQSIEEATDYFKEAFENDSNPPSPTIFNKGYTKDDRKRSRSKLDNSDDSPVSKRQKNSNHDRDSSRSSCKDSKGFRYNSEGRIICYTDGNCHANGKKGAKAGYGVYFGENNFCNRGEPLQGSVQTNQRAELSGIMKAIELVLKYAPGKQLEIHTDSEYSKKIYTEWLKGWKAKNWRKSDGKMVKNQDIIEPTDRLIKKMETTTHSNLPVTFIWVKGHSGDEGNDMADQLATEGLRKNY